MLLPGIIGGFVNEISDYLDAMWLIQSDSSETIVFSGFERLQQTILDERMDGKHPSFEDSSWLKSQCHGILSAFRQTGLNIVV